ncbi:hypothetical protein ACU4I5_10830 [Ensifer adhaerens]
MISKGLELAAALRRRKRSKSEPSEELSQQESIREERPPDEAHFAETAPERSPFPITGLPEYQSYMPFVSFLPPPIRGEDGEEADEIRHQFLQEALYTAERWHERIEQIHLEGKIDQQKRDDFHEHIANVLDDLRTNADPAFWLSIQDRPKNKFTHELIRDYLAENTNNRPRERGRPSSDEVRFGAKPDFFIPADDFLSQGCILEAGTMTSHLEITNDYIIYGPYRPYPVGLYEVKFDLGFAAKVAVPGLSLTVDVTQAGNILASASRESLNMAYQGAEHTLQFTNSDPGANTEFRVHVSGIIPGAKITFKGVRMFRT